MLTGKFRQLSSPRVSMKKHTIRNGLWLLWWTWGCPTCSVVLLNNNINIMVWTGPGLTGVLHWPFFYYFSQSTSLLRPHFGDDLGSKATFSLLLLLPPNQGVLPWWKEMRVGENAMNWRGKPVARGEACYCPCSALLRWRRRLFHSSFFGTKY